MTAIVGSIEKPAESIAEAIAAAPKTVGGILYIEQGRVLFVVYSYHTVTDLMLAREILQRPIAPHKAQYVYPGEGPLHEGFERVLKLAQEKGSVYHIVYKETEGIKFLVLPTDSLEAIRAARSALLVLYKDMILT